jgi:hypothetical protein
LTAPRAKGKYRIVDQKTAQNARNLLEIAGSLISGMEALLVEAATGPRQHTRIAWQEVFLTRGLKEPHGQLEKLWLVVDC